MPEPLMSTEPLEPLMPTEPVEGPAVSPLRLLSVAPQCLSPPPHDDIIEASMVMVNSHVCPPSHEPMVDESYHRTADVAPPPFHVAAHKNHDEGYGIGHGGVAANLDVHSDSNGTFNGHEIKGQMGPMCDKIEQQPDESIGQAPLDPQLGLQEAVYAKMLVNTFDIPVKEIARVSTHTRHYTSIE